MNAAALRNATIVVLLACTNVLAANNDPAPLFELGLEDLLQVRVVSASGVNESLRNAPGAMMIVTAADIRNRGYTDLTEIISDLPGFDSIVANGAAYFTAYQRGYRTPYMQRTLFLINGIVDNHLWTQTAAISRQFPLSNIERIEVLYGPAGAVYGPNAFLGVINIITRDPRKLPNHTSEFSTQLQSGSFNTTGVDMSARGREDQIAYSFSLKLFDSDEPALKDYAPWGYAQAHWLRDQRLWGPVLKQGHNDIAYGEYADRSHEWGFLGDISVGNLKVGAILWQGTEGYGMQYAFDHAQPNGSWSNDSSQVYLQHEKTTAQDINVKSLLKYRRNNIWGDWAEATPDWNPGMSHYSYVSISQWIAPSQSWEFRQDYEFKTGTQWQFSGGLKWEEKELSKAYAICGYWADALCTNGINDLGPEGFGQGIYHSTRTDMTLSPPPSDTMPASNIANTTDRGAYAQAIYDVGNWRYQGALRADHNSIYGSFIKPRISTIWRFNERGTFKLMYGEAFQEPSPLLLWGGWQGRAANPDLKPEEVSNYEFITMYQMQHWLHDLSVYYARYDNVIKEEAENAGQRHVRGLEYRGRFTLDNLIDGLSNIDGYFYYSWTDARSSIHYDQATGKWVEGWAELGDIAKNKVSAGMDWPIWKSLRVDLRSNWVQARTLYLRNPLREQGEKAGAYTTFDLNITADWKPFSLSLKVRNLFDEQYYEPGMEQAESGDDFTQRALGFRNSLLPQVGRNYLLMFTVAL